MFSVSQPQRLGFIGEIEKWRELTELCDGKAFAIGIVQSITQLEPGTCFFTVFPTGRWFRVHRGNDCLRGIEKTKRVVCSLPGASLATFWPAWV